LARPYLVRGSHTETLAVAVIALLEHFDSKGAAVRSTRTCPVLLVHSNPVGSFVELDAHQVAHERHSECRGATFPHDEDTGLEKGGDLRKKQGEGRGHVLETELRLVGRVQGMGLQTSQDPEHSRDILRRKRRTETDPLLVS
jgi:hypothetical protein